MIFAFFSKIIAVGGLSVALTLPNFLFAHVPDAPRSANKNTAAINVRAPDFVLVNQDSQRFDSAQLRGKVLVLNFIFTTCTDVCPLFTANLVQLQRKLNGRFGDDIFLVSITTDPEVDSAKHLIKKGRGLVQHTSLTTVIDRQGIRRFNYLGEKWRIQDLERDLLILLDKKA
jgi:protein SCO1/2